MIMAFELVVKQSLYARTHSGIFHFFAKFKQLKKYM